MADAFISYRRKPSASLAMLLQEKLMNQNKVDGYLDTTRTDSTQVQFPERLMRAIEDAPVFICLLGDSTLESEWVLKEIRKAHQLNKFCIPVFQESYKAPENPEGAVLYLLNFDGVHIFDQKNIYIDTAVKKIANLIPRKKPSRKPIILVSFLIFILLGFAIFIPLVNDLLFPTTATELGTPVATVITENVSSEGLNTSIIEPSPVPTLSPKIILALNGVSNNSQWTAYIQEFNGVEMALVPASTYQMGSLSEGDEQPIHEIQFDTPFWIDQYEVSNGQFLQFGGYAERGGFWTASDLPRENITLFEAQNFCELRGARLPTEAEWEYVARGPDNLTYPWGNTFSRDVVNYCDGNCPYEEYFDELADDGYRNTAPVNTFSEGSSWVGAQNLSGNVWEWVSSLYLPYPYRVNHESVDESVDLGLLRGGSWGDTSNTLRASFRNDFYPTNANSRVGFRCVRDFDIEVEEPTQMPSITPISTNTPLPEPTATQAVPDLVVTATPDLVTADIITLAQNGVSENDDWTPYSRNFDSSDMVLVPSGCFIMGYENGDGDEQPVNEQCMDSFWVDKYEVSISQFLQFLNETINISDEGASYLNIAFMDDAHIQDDDGSYEAIINYENHPIAYVSWFAARDYCAWRGAKLPTEAQ